MQSSGEKFSEKAKARGRREEGGGKNYG